MKLNHGKNNFSHSFAQEIFKKKIDSRRVMCEPAPIFEFWYAKQNINILPLGIEHTKMERSVQVSTRMMCNTSNSY
jgi:hypothetical protein